MNVSQYLVVFVLLFSFRMIRYGIRKHSGAQGIQYVRLVGYARINPMTVSQDLVVFVLLFFLTVAVGFFIEMFFYHCAF